jgi:hypothetical protein
MQLSDWTYLHFGWPGRLGLADVNEKYDTTPDASRRISTVSGGRWVSEGAYWAFLAMFAAAGAERLEHAAGAGSSIHPCTRERPELELFPTCFFLVVLVTYDSMNITLHFVFLESFPKLGITGNY